MSYHEHFICNYGPTGNIPGQPVYRIGPPCSGCEEGTGCTLDYPALCSGTSSIFVNRVVFICSFKDKLLKGCCTVKISWITKL